MGYPDYSATLSYNVEEPLKILGQVKKPDAIGHLLYDSLKRKSPEECKSIETKSRLVVVRARRGGGEEGGSVGMGFLSVMKMPERKIAFELDKRWWLYNAVNVLTTIELSTLK